MNELHLYILIFIDLKMNVTDIRLSDNVIVIMLNLELYTRPGPLFEGNPVGEGTTRRGTATPCIVRKDPGFHTQLDEGPETP